jgi:MFS family permease
MPADDSSDARRAARYALVVLTGINLFNYLDRWVLAAVNESIKPALGLSDTELGTVATGFILVYMATSPVFGALGDRRKRPPLIALGVVIWSVATALAGFARGYWSLFAARSFVGVGEAAYGTIAPALLADFFPLARRGRIFAIFFAAIPIGSAAGYVVGGLADQHLGWRAAFWVAGAPGLLLTALVLRVREMPRGGQDEAAARESGEPVPHAAAHESVLAAYRHLLRNGQFVLTCLGYAAWTFAIGGLAFWMPSFLERVRGLPRQEATVTFGAIVLVTGFVGTFAGGWIADWLHRYTSQSYLWVCGVATLLAAPLTFVAFTAASKTVYLTAIVIAEVLAFASTGPVNSAIVTLVAPTERATAVALSILVMHLLGDVPSPPLIGWASDHSSLARAFMIVPVAILISGAIWSFGAWRGGRQQASA